MAKGRLLRSWSAAAERGHGEGAPRIRLGSHGEMQRAMHAGGILLPAAGKAHRHAGGALCEMLPVTAPHAASAVTLCWDQLGDASPSPKKNPQQRKYADLKDRQCHPDLLPQAGAGRGGGWGPLPCAVSARGCVSSRCELCSQLQSLPSEFTPARDSRSGDSTDASRGAAPLSRGERETWSRRQHFGNSAAPERDPPARGGGHRAVAAGRRERVDFHGIVGFHL